MPYLQSGTISKRIENAISELKATMLEYDVDHTGMVHIHISKLNFPINNLLDNIKPVQDSKIMIDLRALPDPKPLHDGVFNN